MASEQLVALASTPYVLSGLATVTTLLLFNLFFRDAFNSFYWRWYRTTATNRSDQEKSAVDGVASIGSEYLHDFPPSRRESLSPSHQHLPDTFPDVAREKPTEPPAVNPDNCTPMDVPSHDLSGDMMTPTGLSMAEVRALGDFPDYAALSGVPDPQPYHGFDIDKALPRPYRPLRWKYHQTMSLSRLDHDWWLELDSTYRDRMRERKAVLQQHGDTILRYSEGAELACKETMELALSFLVTRYPEHFSFSPDKTHFHNHILGTSSQVSPPAQHPLHVLFDHIPEDFVLMQRDHRTGHYVLRAGSIVSSVGWTLGEKFGQPLHEIHGPVPHYASKMAASMSRFFARLPTDRPIQRASWDVCPGRMLFATPDDPAVAARAAGQARPPRPLADLHLRIDWQTLRRLPLSGAVCFNFKCRFTPMRHLKSEPYVPALLGKILRDGDEHIEGYKMHDHTAQVGVGRGDQGERGLADVLDEWAREQADAGLVEKDWEPHTLSEYPFFPGWEEQWHAMQGF